MSPLLSQSQWDHTTCLNTSVALKGRNSTELVRGFWRKINVADGIMPKKLLTEWWTAEDWERLSNYSFENRGWTWTYIVKKGITRRLQSYKFLKTPIKMKKKKVLIIRLIWQDKVQFSGAANCPKNTEKFYSSLWIARQWKIFVSCWTLMIFQSCTEKQFFGSQLKDLF